MGDGDMFYWEGGAVNAAEEYRKAGRVPLPIEPGEKRTKVAGWSDPAVTVFDILEGMNLAWRLDGLIDIDLDSPTARLIARLLLPRTGARCGRPAAGEPGHWFYLDPNGEAQYEKIRGPNNETILEVRCGTGHYTLVPPSVMPAARGLPQERSAWRDPGPPLPSSPAVAGIIRQARIVAACTILADALGRHGYGHDARLEVAGFLLRLGLSVEEATEAGEAISVPTENTERADVRAATRTTADALNAGREASGGPALAKRIGPAGAAAVAAAETALLGGIPKKKKEGPPDRAGDGRPWTESGDAETFADMHGALVRFDHRRGRWLLYGAPLWRPQTDGQAQRLALATARARQVEALGTDGDQRQARLRWAVGGESRARRSATLALAENTLPIADEGTTWDLDDWVLGTPTTLVDLRTGLPREGGPGDKITMATRAEWQEDARSSLWEDTVANILGGDMELVAYFQRFAGYSICGDCREEALVVCWGNGRNGKGTLMNTIGWALGDYADDLPFSAFELSGRGSIPNDIAKIDGKRFVTSSETSETARLNESRVKALTGRDPITARFMRQEWFTFQPKSKFWLATNNKPDVKDDSSGFWSRIHLLPFTQNFEGREDKTLKDRLRLELPAILAWLVKGCLEWQKIGLRPPLLVSGATNEWRAESDPLAPYIGERCVVAPEAHVKASAIYADYVRWSKARGLREPFTQKAFGSRLRRQFAADESGRHVKYMGIGLLAREEADGWGEE